MPSKADISGKNQQISVEMAYFPLTKRAGRLNVDFGAVLRTRMNTGVYRAAIRSAVQVAGDELQDRKRSRKPMLNPNSNERRSSQHG
jgi:hypothetical protein